MKERIYVCHTYYHVYITILKELAMSKADYGKATLVLSKMSNDFGELKSRAEAVGLFEEILELDEKKDTFFPELEKYKKDKGNILFNMISRIQYTKKFVKLQEKYIHIPFKEYKQIYVYCDADPIGLYLNQKRIRYHALEDGLNSLVYIDHARFANQGAFGLKAFMSKQLNLIFVQNGYGKYCIDMEVNDIESIKHPCKYYIEQSRQELTERLTAEDKELLLKVFVNDIDELQSKIEECKAGKGSVLILTDPLCSLDVREQIFRDIIDMYKQDYRVFIKPHPRDELDYASVFAEYAQFDPAMPMEILNLFEDFQFDKAVGVLTEMKAVKFAKEAIRLGPDFMDKYEEPEIHRQNERI